MKHIDDFDFMQEAFRSLDDITAEEEQLVDDEKTKFDLADADDISALTGVMSADQNIDDDPISMVIDVDADEEEDLKPSYEGEAILVCPSCGKSHFKRIEDLIPAEADEDGIVLYDVDEECPHCHITDRGFKVDFKVVPFDPEEKEIKDDEVDLEAEADTDVEDDISADEVSDETEKPAEIEIKEDDKKEESLKESKDNKSKAMRFRESLNEASGGTVSDPAKYDEFVKKHYDDMVASWERSIERDPEDWEGYCDLDKFVPVTDMITKAILDKKHEMAIHFVDEEIKACHSGKQDPADTMDYYLGLGNWNDGRKEFDEAVVTDEQVLNEKDPKESCEDGKCEEALEEKKEEVKECNESVEDLNENKFNELVTSYLHEVYENADSFETTSGTVDHANNSIIIEGIINFKSGAKKETKFILEANAITNKGKARFVGLNETFSKYKKAFTLIGTLTEGVLEPEKLTYSYRAKSMNESKRVYGTAKLVENVVTESVSLKDDLKALETPVEEDKDKHFIRKTENGCEYSLDGDHWQECSEEEFNKYKDGGYKLITEESVDEGINADKAMALLDKQGELEDEEPKAESIDEAKVHASNIEYDVNDEDAETEEEKKEIIDSLPKELDVDVDDIDDVADAISDDTGYLVKSLDTNLDEFADQFITMAVGEGSDDIYYIGKSYGSAWKALEQLYPDWDELGLGGGDTNPAIVRYLGDNTTEFKNLVKRFRAGNKLTSSDLEVLGWTNYHDLLNKKLPEFKYYRDIDGDYAFDENVTEDLDEDLAALEESVNGITINTDNGDVDVAVNDPESITVTGDNSGVLIDVKQQNESIATIDEEPIVSEEDAMKAIDSEFPSDQPIEMAAPLEPGEIPMAGNDEPIVSDIDVDNAIESEFQVPEDIPASEPEENPEANPTKEEAPAEEQPEAEEEKDTELQ